MYGRQMLHPLPAVIVARGCLYLGTEILTRPAAGVQATCPPLSCRRGAVVTCSRTIYPTVARLQVRACLVVLGTGMGGGCGRAALCAHGRAMPVTRLRVLRQMPHPVPEVSGPRSHRRRLQTESMRQLEVCPTEFAYQNKTAVSHAIRTWKRTPTMCFPGKVRRKAVKNLGNPAIVQRYRC